MPPIKSELQSLPQDERTQESVGDSLSASSRQNPAIGGSRPEDTGSVESSKHVQIPGVDSPPMTDDIPSELQIADQLPLISDLADAAEIEDVHNASKPSASTTTSQAVKDILAMQAKIPIEEKATSECRDCPSGLGTSDITKGGTTSGGLQLGHVHQERKENRKEG